MQTPTHPKRSVLATCDELLGFGEREERSSTSQYPRSLSSVAKQTLHPSQLHIPAAQADILSGATSAIEAPLIARNAVLSPSFPVDGSSQLIARWRRKANDASPPVQKAGIYADFTGDGAQGGVRNRVPSPFVGASSVGPGVSAVSQHTLSPIPGDLRCAVGASVRETSNDDIHPTIVSTFHETLCDTHHDRPPWVVMLRERDNAIARADASKVECTALKHHLTSSLATTGAIKRQYDELHARYTLQSLDFELAAQQLRSELDAAAHERGDLITHHTSEVSLLQKQCAAAAATSDCALREMMDQQVAYATEVSRLKTEASVALLRDQTDAAAALCALKQQYELELSAATLDTAKSLEAHISKFSALRAGHAHVLQLASDTHAASVAKLEADCANQRDATIAAEQARDEVVAAAAVAAESHAAELAAAVASRDESINILHCELKASAQCQADLVGHHASELTTSQQQCTDTEQIHRDQLTQLQLEHAHALAAEISERDALTQRHTLELAAALARSESQTAENAALHRAVLREAAATHSASIQKMRDELASLHAQSAAAVLQAHAAEVEALRAGHTSVFRLASDKHAASVAKLEADYANQRDATVASEQARAEVVAAAAVAADSHAAELADVVASRDESIQQLRSELKTCAHSQADLLARHASELTVLQQHCTDTEQLHRDLMIRLQLENAHMLAAALVKCQAEAAALCDALTQRHTLEIEASTDHFESQTSENAALHSAVLREAAATHSESLQQMRDELASLHVQSADVLQAHSAEVEALRTGHTRVLRLASDKHAASVAKLEADCASQRDATVAAEQARAEVVAAAAVADDSHAAELAGFVASRDEAIQRLRSELETCAHSQADLIARHASELTVWQQQCNDAVKMHRDQVAQLQLEHAQTLAAEISERDALTQRHAVELARSESKTAENAALHSAALHKAAATHSATLQQMRDELASLHVQAADVLQAHAAEVDALHVGHTRVLRLASDKHAASVAKLEADCANQRDATIAAEQARAELVAAAAVAAESLADAVSCRDESIQLLQRELEAANHNQSDLISRHASALTLSQQQCTDTEQLHRDLSTRLQLDHAHALAAEIDNIQVVAAATVLQSQNEATAERETLTQRHALELAAALARSESHTDENAALHRAVLREAAATHSASLQQMRNELASLQVQTAAAVLQAHAAEVEALRSGHTRVLRLASVKHAASVAKLESDYANQRDATVAAEQARAEVMAAAAVSAESHAAELADVVATRDESIRLLRSELETCAECQADLIAHHVSEFTVLQQHCTDTEQLHRDQLTQLQLEHSHAIAAALAKCQTEAAALCDALTQRHVLELAASVARSESQTDENAVLNIAALHAAAAIHSASIQQLRDELASVQVKAAADMLQAHAAEVDALRADHTHVLQLTSDKHAASVARLEADCANQRDATIAAEHALTEVVAAAAVTAESHTAAVASRDESIHLLRSELKASVQCQADLVGHHASEVTMLQQHCTDTEQLHRDQLTQLQLGHAHALAAEISERDALTQRHALELEASADHFESQTSENAALYSAALHKAAAINSASIQQLRDELASVHVKAAAEMLQAHSAEVDALRAGHIHVLRLASDKHAASVAKLEADCANQRDATIAADQARDEVVAAAAVAAASYAAELVDAVATRDESIHLLRSELTASVQCQADLISRHASEVTVLQQQCTDTEQIHFAKFTQLQLKHAHALAAEINNCQAVAAATVLQSQNEAATDRDILIQQHALELAATVARHESETAENAAFHSAALQQAAAAHSASLQQMRDELASLHVQSAEMLQAHSAEVDALRSGHIHVLRLASDTHAASVAKLEADCATQQDATVAAEQARAEVLAAAVVAAESHAAELADAVATRDESIHLLRSELKASVKCQGDLIGRHASEVTVLQQQCTETEQIHRDQLAQLQLEHAHALAAEISKRDALTQRHVLELAASLARSESQTTENAVLHIAALHAAAATHSASLQQMRDELASLHVKAAADVLQAHAAEVDALCAGHIRVLQLASDKHAASVAKLETDYATQRDATVAAEHSSAEVVAAAAVAAASHAAELADTVAGRDESIRLLQRELETSTLNQADLIARNASQLSLMQRQCDAVVATAGETERLLREQLDALNVGYAHIVANCDRLSTALASSESMCADLETSIAATNSRLQESVQTQQRLTDITLSLSQRCEAAEAALQIATRLETERAVADEKRFSEAAALASERSAKQDSFKQRMLAIAAERDAANAAITVLQADLSATKVELARSSTDLAYAQAQRTQLLLQHDGLARDVAQLTLLCKVNADAALETRREAEAAAKAQTEAALATLTQHQDDHRTVLEQLHATHVAHVADVVSREKHQQTVETAALTALHDQRIIIELAALASLKDEQHTAAIQQIIVHHQQEVSLSESAACTERDLLTESHALKLDVLDRSNSVALQQLRSELEAAASQIKADLIAQYESKSAQLMEQHDTALCAQQTEHSHIIATLTAQFELDIAAVKVELDDLRAACQGETLHCSDVLQQLTATHAAELEALSVEVASQRSYLITGARSPLSRADSSSSSERSSAGVTRRGGAASSEAASSHDSDRASLLALSSRFEAVKELTTAFVSHQRESGHWAATGSAKSRDLLSVLARMLELSPAEMEAVGCNDDIPISFREATVRMLGSSVVKGLSSVVVGLMQLSEIGRAESIRGEYPDAQGLSAAGSLGHTALTAQEDVLSASPLALPTQQAMSPLRRDHSGTGQLATPAAEAEGAQSNDASMGTETTTVSEVEEGSPQAAPSSTADALLPGSGSEPSAMGSAEQREGSVSEPEAGHNHLAIDCGPVEAGRVQPEINCGPAEAGTEQPEIACVTIEAHAEQPEIDCETEEADTKQSESGTAVPAILHVQPRLDTELSEAQRGEIVPAEGGAAVSTVVDDVITLPPRGTEIISTPSADTRDVVESTGGLTVHASTATAVYSASGSNKDTAVSVPVPVVHTSGWWPWSS